MLPLLRQRRTVKPHDMDSARPVPRELVESILTDATWAPTHGLTEPWRFRVYQSASARQQLAETLQTLYRETTPSQEFRADKMEKMGQNPVQAPVVILAWMERHGGDKIPELEEIEAVACALQNAMISATASELGSFWSSPPLLETAAFKQHFGLRAQDRALALLYLGYPRATAPQPMRIRRNVREVATWVE